LGGYRFQCSVGQHKAEIKKRGISQELIERLRIDKMTLDQMRALVLVVEQISTNNETP